MSGGFWSGAGAGLISGAMSLAGNTITSAINSSRAWKYTRQAMLLQDELNRKNYQWTGENGPSIARKGYEQAGYNPLLALGSSLGPSGAIYSGSGSNSDSDSGSQAVASAIDALRLRNENRLNKSQVKLNQSQEDLNTQATYKTFADELKSRAEANVASATEAKLLNDIRWDNVIKDAEFKQIIANTRYTNERSRGYSASSSQSRSYGAGAFSVKGDYSQHSSSSRSW